MLVVLILPESCAEILLQNKAAKLRKQSGDARLISKRDAKPLSAHVLVNTYFARPFLMLLQEPIVSFLAGAVLFLPLMVN